MRVLKLLWFFIFTAFSVQAECQETTFGDDLKEFTVMITKHHVAPRDIDDSLSADFFKDLMLLTDPMALVFLESDFDSLSKFRYQFDDEMLSGSGLFFDTFTSIYKKRVENAHDFLKNTLSLPLDLYKKDTLWFRGDEFPEYASDSVALQKRWTRYIKYRVLNQLFDKDSATDPVFTMSEVQLEPLIDAALERSQVRENRKLDRFVKHQMGYNEIMKVVFLNLLAECFDPHTSYFNPELNRKFQAIVSASDYTFGFETEEDINGNIKISELLPGGPAWISNQMNKGDILTGGTWQGGEKADFTTMSADEVDVFLESSVNKYLTLEIRKADGKTESVVLKKEKIRQNEEIVRSFILQKEHTVGYIILPAFYTEAGKSNPGCANDVAREILKLKKEGIEGIVLDLRYNGGGSIQEALDLAGIFIDVGPVCIYSERNSKPFTLKDINRGVAWDGPLVLMVNNYSASASEILAGALQDYNRALIVGQTTYGKASGQIVLPLDSTIAEDLSNMADSRKKNGFIKVTTMKIYRINGTSHQRSGVIPDIQIPDAMGGSSETESDNKYSLCKDTIIKKTYYTPLPAFHLDTLNLLEKKRLGESEYEQQMNALSDSMDLIVNDEYVLFDLESYRDYYQKVLTLYEKLEDIEDGFKANYEVLNHFYDRQLLISDEYFKIVNQNAMENIQQDFELEQAFQIMENLIKMKNQ
ncbi:MAG: hypothetical protein CVU11_12310 [Bacteroidetes bacterium HGW-Bacteroidetes-6]|jgi:carboxyl-terminal processing protease|nr:MAG: hypothetical protein CVU11_12310 [Bacteroidetes bacterium HGW-Bacteroidetes-6]